VKKTPPKDKRRRAGFWRNRERKLMKAHYGRRGSVEAKGKGKGEAESEVDRRDSGSK